MSNSFKGSRAQGGSVLVESLVGVALAGIVGAGSLQIASRIATAHHELRVEGMVIEQLRNLLTREGDALCNPASRHVRVPGNDQAAALAIACEAEEPLEISPAVVGASAAATITVQTSRPVTATVLLSDLGIAAGTSAGSIMVGTRP